ncbi:ketol-acid reductoisomerase (NAD(+)) [Spirochaetota bacterium]|nr:ketol-acid reductoisomerase (NAD(+)) [Spirochaetota bacterium]
MKIYYDEDGQLAAYKDKTIAVIGYGSQGHAQALNLRDSGIHVIIGQRPGGPNYDKAKTDGFNPISAQEAAAAADIIQLVIPDEWQQKVYKADIEPHLKPGKALVFSHGFNIHFKNIIPPKDIDVYMVAPKGPGHTVRREYKNNTGVPALIAIYQNATGSAKNLALAHAKGIGATRVGVLETTFKEETETDLFGEQAVLCGGLTQLIVAGFETLVNAGYSKEMAYFECLHEMKLIIDLIYEGGISNMLYSISETAEYGAYHTGPAIITKETRAAMEETLKNIKNGAFAKKFMQEAHSGKPEMTAARKKGQLHPIETVGTDLRKLMKNLFKNKLVQ